MIYLWCVKFSQWKVTNFLEVTNFWKTAFKSLKEYYIKKRSNLKNSKTFGISRKAVEKTERVETV